MDDLAPIAPCPVHPKGRHHLMMVIPDDDGGWLTLACEACGAVRRFPVSGHLTTPLDEMTTEQIKAMVG